MQEQTVASGAMAVPMFVTSSIVLQYNRGRRVKEVWVLGIQCMDFTPARPIFQVVPNRRASTLLPILNYHLLPGTTVTTDGWRAYTNLALTMTHRTVNHSRHFVDPITGECSVCRSHQGWCLIVSLPLASSFNCWLGSR